MFYGVEITSGLQDWQVFQREGGAAKLSLRGRWRLEDGAKRAGVQSVTPVLRAVSEEDQRILLPWRACGKMGGSETEGEWETVFSLPQGGPYRIETSLDAVSAATGEHWMFRGDIRVHVGVGDVFCMAGQSNAAGYAKGWAYDPPDVRVHLLRNSGRWDMAAHPMNDATGAADCLNAPMGITGSSPFLSFAKRYADLTGLPVGLIPTAQGGSPMERWDPRGKGDLYRNMMEKTACCRKVRAVLWYQGCADADEKNADRYLERFERMVASVRQEAGRQVPFFTMQLNRYETQPDAAAWGRVKEMQRRAARDTEGVFILPTAGLPQSDEIHTSAAGNVVLGQMLARQVHGALNDGAPFEAPDLASVRAENGRLRLAFRNTRGLTRLRALHDAQDFALEDGKGPNPIAGVEVREGELLLTPSRPLDGKAFLSYGTDPRGPEGGIVDLETWLPILSFDHVEVAE